MKSLIRYWPIVVLLVLVSPMAKAQQPGQNAMTDSMAQKMEHEIFIRSIQIEGNKLTRPTIILREINLREGEIIKRDSIIAAVETMRLRLINLPLFTNAVVTPVVVSTDTLDLHIAVNERWYLIPEISIKLADRNFNVWWREQNRSIRRINLSLAMKHINFRGNFETLGGVVQVGYKQMLQLNYYRPYINNAQKHGLGFSVMAAQNNEIPLRTDSNKFLFARLAYGSYIQQEYGANLVYTYRPGYTTRHYLELGFRHVQVDDTVLTLNPDFFLNKKKATSYVNLLYRLDYNGVDNWNYPMEGRKLVNYVGVTVGGSAFPFQAFDEVEVGTFRQPSRKWFTSAIGRARLSFPTSQPWYGRRNMGDNSEYVRGYEYYVIDGAHYALGRLNLKRELVNTFIKLPFRFLPVLPIRLYPKVYADAGYAYDGQPGSSTLHNRALYSAGFGVDFVTAYDIKLRVEYTINHLGQRGLYLHLSGE